MTARRVRLARFPFRFIFPALLLLLAPFANRPAAAATISARVEIEPSSRDVAVSNQGVIAMRPGELPLAQVDGAGTLPVAVRAFFVPAGFEVADVRVTRRDETTVATGRLLSTLPRAESEARLELGAPGEAARDGYVLGGGNLAGYRIENVALLPYRFDQATGRLLAARTLDVSLELRPVAARAAGDLVRERHSPEADRVFAEAVAALVANPQDVPAPDASANRSLPTADGFAPQDIPTIDGTAVDMVIVTPASLESTFQTLADWKTKKGVPTVVRTVEWIEANYPDGHDQAERIRIFLRDAYTKWGTYMLLLGGDYSLVPPRSAWNTYFFGGVEIPTDQYYACLDGTWNDDGDQFWGEGSSGAGPGDNADLFPDVFIGRAPVDNVTQAQTFVTKSLLYEKTPPAGYVEDVCHLAEVLFPPEWEFGDPFEQIQRDGNEFTERFDAVFPVGWTRTKRYQSENNLDRTIALTELNAGHHVLNLMAHGDAFKFSVGNGINPLIYLADTDALTNGNRLMFVNATACNPNQFDLECQGESFMNNPNGGAIAVFGPTREDFPIVASDFHEDMLHLIFEQGIDRFGVFGQMHRVPYAGQASSDLTSIRWTMQTRELFGDPDLRLWRSEPATLSVAHAASVPLGTASITVTVTDGGSPVDGALVCLNDGNGTYERARTDAAGQATLPITSHSVGTVNVVATAPNFRPHEGTFTLGAAAGAHLALLGYTLDDDGSGASSGNGDGSVDAGETIELLADVRNGGTVTATGVTVDASIEAGSTATFDLRWNGAADPARVFVGPNAVNPATVPFTLDFDAPAIDYVGAYFITAGGDTALSGDEGIYLWQDREGWHVRWLSGVDSVAVTGTVATDGRVRHALTLDLESVTDTYTIAATEDTLSFSGETGLGDPWDEIAFALADDTKLSVTTASDAIGDIAASTSVVGTTVFAVANDARDGQVGYVDLTFTDGSLNTWAAEVPVVFVTPELEAWVFEVDDSSVPPANGDGDGVIEVGETVRWTPSVLNRGSGAAIAVTGAASAASGITFVDAADAYGELAPLATSSGTDGYVFTVNNGSGTSIDLVLTDSLGRTWSKNVEFVAPAAPIDFAFQSDPSNIFLAWTPNAEPDVAGYHVYRSATPGSGHARVTHELLRTGTRYVDENLAFGSTYYYYVTAVDSSGNESAASAELAAWTTQPQVAGWPQSANSNVFSSPAIVDADNTGNPELYVGSQDFKYYGFQSDAAPIANWPVSANAQIWGTAAFGDLDGDSDLEILFGAMDSRFYAVHHDASPVYGANPWFLDVQGSGQTIRGTPVITDVDFDLNWEFFVGTDAGTVYGFNHDGTPIAGSGPNGLLITVPQSNTFPPRIWGPIASTDLDLDGQRELVFTCWNDSLYVIAADGTRKPGFPKGASAEYRQGPVIADLDGDDTFEIIAANMDGKVYAYEPDGSSYLPGMNGVLFTMPDPSRGLPAPCQLDADPELELVLTCLDGGLYAINHDGTGLNNPSGLLAMTDPMDGFTSSAIVVDVDGDNDFEIFAGHMNGNFYGFHHDGTPIVGLPIPTNGNIFATATAGDLDGDGDVDVAFASYDNTINVLDFSGPSTPAAYEWATYGGNDRRTSVYREPEDLGVGVDPNAPAAVVFALGQNAPNPFSGSTAIRFALPEKAPVSLRVYDVSGRLVRTLVNAPLDAGRHAVTWDGRDDRGRTAASGVYFYRLSSDARELTRKALRLR